MIVLIALIFTSMVSLHAYQQQFLAVDFDESAYKQSMLFNFYGPDDAINYEIIKKNYEINNPTLKQPHQNPLIPKQFIHIWFGDKLPEHNAILRQTAIAVHPDWHFILCADNPLNFQFGSIVVTRLDSLQQCLHDESLKGKTIIFDMRTFDFNHKKELLATPNYGQKSDIFRYTLLNEIGGVYLDCDIKCIAPLDFLNHSYTFFTGLSNSRTVELNNAVIGCAPHHPLMKKILNEMKVPATITSMDDVLNSTGPRFFTTMVIDALKQKIDDLIILPSTYFYPTPQFARITSHADMDRWIRPESLTNHYWSCSWWQSMAL